MKDSPSSLHLLTMNGTCNTFFQCSSTASEVIMPACNVPITKLGNYYTCCIESEEQQQNVLQAYNKIQGSSVGIACGGTGRSNAGNISIRSPSYKIFMMVLVLNLATWLIAGVSAIPSNSETMLIKRDIKCRGFIIKSQEDSFSPGKKVSGITNCGGNPVPCLTNSTNTDGISSSSTFYISTKGNVNGVNVERTFGAGYIDSTSISKSDGYLVPINQCGYLVSYSLSTLFKGTWTDCDGQNQEGEANVIRKNGQQNKIVLTTC